MADVMPAQAERVSSESQPTLQETSDSAQQLENMSRTPDQRDSSRAGEVEEHKKQEEMSAIEKIKAAQAARRNRRTRPQPVSTSSPPTAATTTTTSAAGDESSDVPAVAAIKKAHEEQIAALRQEAASLRLEMGSLRRNHLQNIKKITEERDMFAMQLANEQTAGKSDSDNRKLEDINVQLRAARTRNNDLESENSTLRDEVKQLNFRVHASKTLDAASDGYEKIVDDLVNVKLKCAQLQEEKEDLLRMNKELMTTSSVLRDANGDLEKSRSEWVVRCAELEKQKQDIEDKLQDSLSKGIHNDASDSGSLQDIKLN